MPSDRSSITTSELDAALTATASSRLLKGKNQVAFLGNVATPTLNAFRAIGKTNNTPVRGMYKVHMASPRGQKLQSVSGRDINTFRSVDTLFDVEYSVGRVHLGDEWVHQQLEEAGIEIDEGAASQTSIDITKAGWWTKGAESFETLVNLANQKLESLELNYVQELNKTFWRSNIADSKLWPGIDALIARSTNTTGAVGSKTRANQYLRHQIANISNNANIEKDLDNMRELQKRTLHDNTAPNLNVCGRTFYNAVKEYLFTGSNAVSAPRFTRNLDVARSEAQTMATKWGIGMPDDAIFISGVGILTVEACFADLDAEDAPSIAWDKSYFSFNTDHIKFIPTKKKDGASKIHATPYNQRVTRISKYGEYACVADRLDCHGTAYIA
jgi:hypothetical protein